jgi:putative lipoprotein
LSGGCRLPSIRAADSAVLVCLLLAACSAIGVAAVSGSAATAQVTGTVAYRERIALRPTALIKVQLIDASRADARAVVLGEAISEAGGRQPPFAFSIAYDPAKIEENRAYAVQARIEEDGSLRFINDQRHAVITRGAPTRVEMVLIQVGGRLPR